MVPIAQNSSVSFSPDWTASIEEMWQTDNHTPAALRAESALRHCNANICSTYFGAWPAIASRFRKNSFKAICPTHPPQLLSCFRISHCEELWYYLPLASLLYRGNGGIEANGIWSQRMSRHPAEQVQGMLPLLTSRMLTEVPPFLCERILGTKISWR